MPFETDIALRKQYIEDMMRSVFTEVEATPSSWSILWLMPIEKLELIHRKCTSSSENEESEALRLPVMIDQESKKLQQICKLKNFALQVNLTN
jgi:hypothetical protein